MTRGERSQPSFSPALKRLPILALVMALLTVGVWVGLRRIGWQFAAADAHIISQHGPLMISGFIGSMIALERAVALSIFDRKPPGQRGKVLRWLVPIFSTVGSILLLWPASARAGRWIITAASLGLLLVTLRILDLTPSLHTLLMAVGAGGWAFGNLLWLGGIRFSTLLPAWAVFVILTIAGERFELNRIRQVGQWMLGAFYAGGGLVLAGALLAPLNSNLAIRSSGLGALILAIWLLKFDVARRSLRMAGLPRFSAAAVLSSFGWLGLYGVIALRFGFLAGGPIYDAVIHCLFLGFAVGMIVGHAPIIMPAFLGRRASFHPRLVAPAIGLHLSIALRVISDLAGWHTGRQWGGLMNAAFGWLYILALAHTLWTARHAE